MPIRRVKPKIKNDLKPIPQIQKRDQPKLEVITDQMKSLSCTSNSIKMIILASGESANSEVQRLSQSCIPLTPEELKDRYSQYLNRRSCLVFAGLRQFYLISIDATNVATLLREPRIQLRAIL